MQYFDNRYSQYINTPYYYYWSGTKHLERMATALALTKQRFSLPLINIGDMKVGDYLLSIIAQRVSINNIYPIIGVNVYRYQGLGPPQCLMSEPISRFQNMWQWHEANV